MSKNIVDLFCGVGGLSLGFQRAGFKVSAAYDNWEKSIAVYNSNFKDHQCHQLDLQNVDEASLAISALSPEGIVGGPPCQDFSSAGKRIEGGRADLTHSFALIVSNVMPNFFVMENVATARNSQSFKRAKSVLANAGYFISEAVLDASFYGVPQKRKRFFCFGSRVKPFMKFDVAVGHLKSAEPMTVRNYFGKDVDFEFYYRHPRNYNRRAIYSIDEPAATIRGVNRPIPPNYPGHRLDASAISSARPLSTQERALIQTFPNDFKWDGTRTNVEQMIGNAVPPVLAEKVATTVNHLLYDIAVLEAAE